MLISNVFINCKAQGKNFFTQKQLKVSSISELTSTKYEENLTPLFTSIVLKCEYMKAGHAIKV